MSIAQEVFRFEIGNFECWVVNDGYHEYSLDTFFANVNKDVLQQALRLGGWPEDRYISPYNCLYIHAGEHHILIDSGVGGAYENTGLLPANLVAAGVAPEEIDMLVVTHAHPDHIGGLLKNDGTLTYPNAAIYTMEQEWDFWLGEDAAVQAPDFEGAIVLAHRVYDILGDRFHYLQPGDELISGIRVLAAFGHTPGHIAVEATSSGESLIHISDASYHPLHMLNPGWLPQEKYIYDTQQYQETARLLVDRAVVNNSLLLGMHFPPFPGLGRLIDGLSGLEWQPVSQP
jgi:glyoxylase-like metal-dependent hydrolase (beta-lactamase superfamily II)